MYIYRQHTYTHTHKTNPHLLPTLAKLVQNQRCLWLFHLTFHLLGFQAVCVCVCKVCLEICFENGEELTPCDQAVVLIVMQNLVEHFGVCVCVCVCWCRCRGAAAAGGSRSGGVVLVWCFVGLVCRLVGMMMVLLVDLGFAAGAAGADERGREGEEAFLFGFSAAAAMRAMGVWSCCGHGRPGLYRVVCVCVGI